ncbi:hypothetical protein KC19_2G110900 [Ceratodon purpureus]|uniref:Uncharacterized protein n=1 Tax=Ceratodon purpureus TaxID=3225 RepID=A0A8T0IVK0_CERPU|nr:hypothetical protein KC19_2G110900 [Ceratodon purpureus]
MDYSDLQALQQHRADGRRSRQRSSAEGGVGSGPAVPSQFRAGRFVEGGAAAVHGTAVATAPLELSANRSLEGGAATRSGPAVAAPPELRAGRRLIHRSSQSIGSAFNSPRVRHYSNTQETTAGRRISPRNHRRSRPSGYIAGISPFPFGCYFLQCLLLRIASADSLAFAVQSTIA